MCIRDRYGTLINVKIKFIGLANEMSTQTNVIQAFENINNHLVFAPRIPKKDLLRELKFADLLLLTAYSTKGVYPVKMFDYYSVEKPILLCPSDNADMENFITETNSGYIANNIDDCYKAVSYTHLDVYKRQALST